MQKLFLHHPALPFVAGMALLVIITTALISVEAFSVTASELPQGFSSERQLLGINLLLILLPSYLVFAWGILQRRSAFQLQAIDQLIGDQGFVARAVTPLPVMVIGGIIGVVYAILFNLPIDTLRQFLDGGSLLICLVLLMILVWLTVGIVLSSRLYDSIVFRQAGRKVPIDPYDHSALEPFARCGMGNVLMTMGALVLTTVQSIDATFRYQNYLFSMLVAVPAGLVLLLRPMSTIHARLKTLKREEFASVNSLIRSAPKSLSIDDISRLEPLLQRRDRVRDIHTWPLNLSMISRLLIYGVIPPAAWIGAALVEMLIENMLGGG